MAELFLLFCAPKQNGVSPTKENIVLPCQLNKNKGCRVMSICDRVKIWKFNERLYFEYTYIMYV